MRRRRPATAVVIEFGMRPESEVVISIRDEKVAFIPFAGDFITFTKRFLRP
jgi:hypothetical protein